MARSEAFQLMTKCTGGILDQEIKDLKRRSGKSCLHGRNSREGKLPYRPVLGRISV